MGPIAPAAKEEIAEEGPAEPSDRVDLTPKSVRSQANEALEKALERERKEKERTYRRPTYPPPPVPVPRQMGQRWLLSQPSPENDKPRSREMGEEDLEFYSRHRDRAEEPDSDDPLHRLLLDPLGTPLRQELVELIYRFGAGILQRWFDFGLSILLGGESSYDADSRRLEASQEDLRYQHWRPVFRALARAYDHALGEGEPASLTALAVLTCLQRSLTPQACPCDYFADALAGYLLGETHPDPAFQAYLDYLITQSRRQELRAS